MDKIDSLIQFINANIQDFSKVIGEVKKKNRSKIHRFSAIRNTVLLATFPIAIPILLAIPPLFPFYLTAIIETILAIAIGAGVVTLILTVISYRKGKRAEDQSSNMSSLVLDLNYVRYASLTEFAKQNLTGTDLEKFVDDFYHFTLLVDSAVKYEFLTLAKLELDDATRERYKAHAEFMCKNDNAFWDIAKSGRGLKLLDDPSVRSTIKKYNDYCLSRCEGDLELETQIEIKEKYAGKSVPPKDQSQNELPSARDVPAIDSEASRKARRKVIELLFPVAALIVVFLGFLEPIFVQGSSSSAALANGLFTYLQFVSNFALYFAIFILCALGVYFIDMFFPKQSEALRFIHWAFTSFMFLFFGVLVSVLLVLAYVGNNASSALTVSVSITSGNFLIILFTPAIVGFSGILMFERRPIS
jgi:hypothetical protein